MSFGDRLKEKREEMGITQVQLAELLGVSKGAIGNYEAGINSPKATMLYKIFDALKCDANFLFQDEMIEEEKEAKFNKHEITMIEQYRTLDSYGKDAVDGLLKTEYERCKDEQESMITLTREEIRKLPLEQRLRFEQFIDEDEGILQVARKRRKDV